MEHCYVHVYHLLNNILLAELVSMWLGNLFANLLLTNNFYMPYHCRFSYTLQYYVGHEIRNLLLMSLILIIRVADYNQYTNRA